MSSSIHPADPDTLTNVKRDDGGSKDAKDVAVDAAEKARDYASEKGKAAGQMVEASAADARDSIVRASDAARDFAVKQPLATVAGALAVGVLLGIALNNRR